jgi:hypothetical protein
MRQYLRGQRGEGDVIKYIVAMVVILMVFAIVVLVAPIFTSTNLASSIGTVESAGYTVLTPAQYNALVGQINGGFTLGAKEATAAAAVLNADNAVIAAQNAAIAASNAEIASVNTLNVTQTNQSNMLLDMGDVRSRAYPWDCTQNLVLTTAADVNVFGTWTSLIPKTTFNFGDSPNWIVLKTMITENTDNGDTYILELASSPDGLNFTPVASMRVSGSTTYVTSFASSRAINNDTDAVYGRIKSASGGAETMQLSFTICRFLPTNIVVPQPVGNNFPFN